MAHTQDDIPLHCFDFIVNHVFLPPQLPQHAEDYTDESTSALLRLLHRCSDAYIRQLATSSFQDSPWPAAVKMLQLFITLETSNAFSAQAFASAVTGMNLGDSIGIYIAAQNAGLFLHRTENSVLVTSYESSPTAASVVTTRGKLLVSFPGPAVVVPWSTMRDPTFLAPFTEFVAKMKREVLAAAAAKATKAGERLSEERETPHPRFMTEMLTGILRAVGQVGHVKRFTKRVGDEALWDNAKIPWRRSPLWLVVRVSLQMVLGVEQYKSFMVYFMARVLDQATRRGIEEHRLFVMNSKVSRRVYKLQDRLPGFVLDDAQAIGDRAHSHIEKEWMTSQGSVPMPHWKPKNLNYAHDTIIKMPRCRAYILELNKFKFDGAPGGSFVPQEATRHRWSQDGIPQLPKAGVTEEGKDIMLADFEAWVMDNLDLWAARLSSTKTRASKDLGHAIESYIAVAKPAYHGNPEKNSIMLLTTMELWMVLDKLALLCCPLLVEYPPEFNESFLSALLLPQVQQRSRLSRIETYINMRRCGALPTSVSIFSKVITEATLSVRYFRTSHSLQMLKDEIEMDAHEAQVRKEAELVAMTEEYDQLQAVADALSCDYFTHWSEGWTRHDRNCRKHKMGRQLDAMRIEVFEWPLPEDPLAAAAVLFELRCPTVFAIWRETTFRILTDLCSATSPPPSQTKCHDTCDTYSGLQKYFETGLDAGAYKINYTSSTKSFLCSHYRYSHLPTTASSICLKNPLRFALHDTRTGIWTADRRPDMDVRHMCTFRLPKGPYEALQYTMRNTSHTANAVLSRQYECPPELQLHEYVAFGLLRSGRRLQWLNMLREIRSRTLTFSAEAVNMLYLQAAWQVGPPGDDAEDRESHVEPGQDEFGREMIRELGEMLRSVEANWQEVVAVQTMIALAGQIVARTRCVETRTAAVNFLRVARRVCLAWARELAGKLPECGHGEVREFQMRVVQMAVTCRMTFDVEECWRRAVLRAGGDVSVLVECATMIRDNVHAVAAATATVTKAVLERDRRLAYAVEQRLRDLITNSHLGLDLKPVWSAYEPGDCWTAMESPNERWVYTYTKETATNKRQKVHYNLITGELLVEGLPIGRLPVSYSNHPTYQELLGEKVLDVFPCSIPEMIFQTKHPIRDLKFAFALHGKELVIRTVRVSNGVMQQYIPRSRLSGDFPTSFIQHHAFWLCLSTESRMQFGSGPTEGRIDLCAVDTPWQPEPQKYIAPINRPTETQLHITPTEQQLDIRSATTTMITSVLAPLEVAEFIIVSLRRGVVQVELPRLKLNFSISKTRKLECKQFPGMVVDDDQRIGTFVGLDNFLVVRLGNTLTRSVFVPCGKVRFDRQRSHTRVRIDTAGLSRVKYLLYAIDPILGRLVGNGSLTSHLYKIYLHAVTSHCHPDPLTRRTGTEEALAGLRAAATKSFQVVETDSVDAQLFRQIAALSPVRAYYPPHLKFMQQVKWISGLPPLAQHEEFAEAVKEVSAYAGLLNIFEDLNGSIGLQDCEDQGLSKRAAIKNAVFRTEQFGGSILEEAKDKVYEARDVLNGSADEARVFHVATLVDRHAEGGLNIHPNILGVLEKTGEVQGLQPVGAPKPQLGYDHKWLEPNMAEVWVALYDALRGTIKTAKKYNWMFLLSTLVYSGKMELKLVETLLAFGTQPAFREIDPPNHLYYDLQHGYEPDIVFLSSTISSHVVDYCNSEESKLAGWALETEQETKDRRFNTFNRNRATQIETLANKIRYQWPCRQPVIDFFDEYPLIQVPGVLVALAPRFDSWNRNYDFQRHIGEVQKALDKISTHKRPALQYYRFEPCARGKRVQVPCTISFPLLLRERSSPALPEFPAVLVEDIVLHKSSASHGPNDDSLKVLLSDFREVRGSKKFRKKYSKGLEDSFEAFHAESTPSYAFDPTHLPLLRQELMYLLETSRVHLKRVFDVIKVRLGPSRLRGSLMISNAGLWPRVSPVLLLQQLATNVSVPISPEWKAVLVTYGIAITMTQRLGRLLRLLPPGNYGDLGSDFFREFENKGHQKWDPLLYPDWLLIEIENNFLIRSVQAEIASSMIAPPENHNSIMQLCMGEGKTSVIVPIVAASLADGAKLVRVVVLKPLSGQMFQTLVQKLGGLVNRRIFFMPFSRGASLGKEQIEMVKSLYDECMMSGGVLLVQPEHILSFKLVGLEWLYNSEHKSEERTADERGKGAPEVAQLLLRTQRWLEENSRDILDESDEILNVKHELIFTIGDPAPIQNHPERWLIIQEIFDLMQDHFKGLEAVSVHDFEVETHEDATRFGSIRILNLQAGIALLREIGKKILNDQLLTVSFRLFPADKRELAARFITDTQMTKKDARPLLKYCGDNDISSGILYLLRGLIAHNIILFSLKEKRWKVDYGLDLKRSLLAVPYRAKDSPAGKAEFSHPDVALTLTCLSYYYGELTESQLETCFRNLYKADNPALDYERWTKGVRLPKPYLSRLHGINLDDRKQWKEIVYPTFHYNKAVIDSYLSGVVFPKEAKEFLHKLSTSGWDLAGLKTHPTTGFSGTNDNRYLLPLSIKQLDTKAQLNTNARVLSYLLQRENSYKLIASPKNERMSVEDLLKMLAAPPVSRQFRVLLDVGAQVLELRNDEVAKKWLSLAPDYSVQAAVYFNDNDELTVLTRDGNTEPLMVSAFAESLGNCLIYLDEAHTRGTDLKLPVGSRAAVTLGPNLTKDRLVQACMRMRKLGNGHSVMFCGPPEIDRMIMKIAEADNRTMIEVRDVLHWSMEETVVNTRKILPIWVKQGIAYQKHLHAWEDIESGGFPEGLLEKEAKSLQEHYGFALGDEETVDAYRKLETRTGELDEILEKCKVFGVSTFRGARMLEEQERELAHEVESERENQRPPKVGAQKPRLADDVQQFITSGKLRQTSQRHSDTIFPAFSVFERTSANEHWEKSAFSQRLLATADFCRVVETETKKDSRTDYFLRPVNWIISSTVDRRILVILSSFEANRLLPEIRRSRNVHLHMYSPRVTLSTPTYESLQFCTIPPLPHLWQPDIRLVDQLNIFSGQLYFRNYKAYKRVCGFLGLYLEEPTAEMTTMLQCDGFVKKSHRNVLGMDQNSPFEKSPVPFLKALVGFRRKGQNSMASHMGHALHGRLLKEEYMEMPGSEEDMLQDVEVDMEMLDSEEEVEDRDLEEI